MSKAKQIIIGIDPGFATCGYACISTQGQDIEVLCYGAVTTPATDEFTKRLQSLHQELSDLFTTYKPNRLAIEQLYFAKNTKTAIKVAHARGIMLLLAAQHKLAIHEYTPLQVKQALTTYGRADKQQMQKMIQKILKLETIPTPDDAADALALAWYAAQQPY